MPCSLIPCASSAGTTQWNSEHAVINAKQPFVHKLASEFPRWPWRFTSWANAIARCGTEAWTASGGLDHQGMVQLCMPGRTRSLFAGTSCLPAPWTRLPRGATRSIEIWHRGPGQQNLLAQDHTSLSRACCRPLSNLVTYSRESWVEPDFHAARHGLHDLTVGVKQAASVKGKSLAQWRSVFTSICLSANSARALRKFPELGLPDLEMPCAPHAVHIPSPQRRQPPSTCRMTNDREPDCIRLCAAPAGRICAPLRVLLLSGMALTTCSSYPFPKHRSIMTAVNGPARLMERPARRRAPLSVRGLSTPGF